MSRPSRRLAGAAKFAAVPAALVIAGAVVGTASHSAYTATTTTPASSFTTGKLNLTNSSPTTALLNLDLLKPLSTVTKCITVTSTGTISGVMKMYTTSVSSGTNGLGSFINLTVQPGSGSTDASCTGFVADSGVSPLATTLTSFGSSYTSYLNGYDASTIAAGGSRSYQITYTVSSAATNVTQGDSASLGLTWEIQS